MKIYFEEEDFFDLDYWSDALLIEFEAGQGICVPKPERDGRNYVYFDSTLMKRSPNMPLDIYQWLNAVRFYNNYSMDNDSKLAAKYVRTRNLN